MSEVNRRQFLKLAAAATLDASLLASCARQSGVDAGSAKSTAHDNAKQLNIFSWADYLPPDAIANFEKRYGIKVVYDTFGSNEALLARMEAGSVDYDIIVPSSYAVAKLKRLKLLKEIDHDAIPNVKNLMGRFANMAYDPGGKYSVAYTFGTTGIGYNSAALKQRGVAAPDDWDVFWDERLKGRMTLLEDARESIGFALKRRGYSQNSVNPDEIKLATQDLIKQKPLTMCYTSDQVIVYLAGGDSLLSLAYSGDAHQATRTNQDVEYIIPKSGASLWVDNMCIPASAPHPENAHKWINYILEPEVSAALTNFTYYPTPNHAALKFVKPAMLEDKTLYPSEAVLEKCEELKDIGNGIFIYDRAWTELKCV